MKIGIDLDGCISAYPDVFSILTRTLKTNDEITIYILTAREQSCKSYCQTEDELEKYGIEYDRLIITDNKQKFIKDNGISLLIDDQDENFKRLGPEVCCLKVREEMNYCFDTYRWYYDKNIGIFLPEK